MSDDALDEVAQRYRDALPPGRLQEFGLTGYDRTGVPVVATVFDPAGGGPDAHGVGYGATTAQATVGALGELAERVLLAPAVRALPRRRAAYGELVAELGRDAVVDPLTLALEAGSDYAPDRPLDWVPTTRWRTGEQVLVPVEFVAFDADSLPADPPPGGWLTTAVTNGLGAGDSPERAVAHALLELLQRDGDTVSFRALDPGDVVDLSMSNDPATHDVVRQLRDAAVEPVVKLASTEFCCVVYCVGRDDDPDVDPMALGAVGEAADPDRDVAVRKALLEFASSRARRVFAFGPLDRVARLSPAYLEAELRRPLGAQEPRALREMAAWARTDAPAMRALLDPYFRHERRRVPVADLPAAPAPVSQGAALADLLDRLTGFDVLVAAGGGGDGMHAVKVVVPGLEVETLSYRRIGERVARRLLERGSDLVGPGAPDRPARRAVRLTAAAVERLGGPVWLDVDAVDRTVGRLYPLYREPRRHAVQRSGAAR